MIEAPLIRRGERRRDPLHQDGRDFVEEPGRLGRLVLAEDTTTGSAGEDQVLLGARDPDVTEPPLLLELVVVFSRTRVREEPFLHTRNHDHRELEPLGRVHRHHPDARVPACPTPRPPPTAATADRRTHRVRLLLA